MNLDLDRMITAGWLTEVLRQHGVLTQGAVVDLRKSARLQAMSAVLHLKVTYSENAHSPPPARLILKLTSAGLEAGGSKEVQFYSKMAPEMEGLPIVRCFGAANWPELDRDSLLLEDLSDTHFAHPPAQLPPLQIYCQQIVDGLADLHAHWWDHPGLGVEIGGSPMEEVLELSELMSRKVPEFMDFLGDRISRPRRQLFETALSSLEAVFSARLTPGRGITLVHGDIHIGNFLYPRDPDRETVRILDWKSWGAGLGTDDLAHMMALFWFPERRARLEVGLLRRYHDRLLERGVRAYDRQTCWRDYRLSVIRYLYYPVWQWSQGMPADIWWHHLERILLAFEDLGCAQLLES